VKVTETSRPLEVDLKSNDSIPVGSEAEELTYTRGDSADPRASIRPKLRLGVRVQTAQGEVAITTVTHSLKKLLEARRGSNYNQTGRNAKEVYADLKRTKVFLEGKQVCHITFSMSRS